MKNNYSNKNKNKIKKNDTDNIGISLRHKNQFYSGSELILSDKYYSKSSLLNFSYFKSQKGCICGEDKFVISCEELRSNRRDETRSKSNDNSGIFAILKIIQLGIEVIEEITDSCIEVPEINETPLNVWKNTIFCTERMALNYLDFVLVEFKSSCPKFYNKCGIVDDYNNWLCIPEKFECPINYFKFLKNEVLEKKNKIEQIYNVESNEKNYIILGNDKIANRINKKEKTITNNLDLNSKMNDTYSNKILSESETNKINKIPKKNLFRKQDIQKNIIDNKIFANFKITIKSPCDESIIEENSLYKENSILQLSSSQEKLLFSLKSENMTELYSNKKLKNIETLSIGENTNYELKDGEYAYKAYFTFQDESDNPLCNDENSEIFFESIKKNKQSMISKMPKKYRALDKMKLKDLYFQNNLLDKIIDLPNFPKQNLYFNTTLYSQVYSGMQIGCREIILNLINYDTHNFIQYMKNLKNKYPNSNSIFFLFFILISFSFCCEFGLLIVERKYEQTNSKNFLHKSNVKNIQVFLLLKIFELMSLIPTIIYLLYIKSNLLFESTFNYHEDYSQIIPKDKDFQNLLYEDCNNNQNFNVLTNFYDNNKQVCFYINIIYYISLYLIIQPIFRLRKEYTEEENTQSDIHRNLND